MKNRNSKCVIFGCALAILVWAMACGPAAPATSPVAPAPSVMPWEVTPTPKRATPTPTLLVINQQDASEIAMTMRANYPLWTCVVMLDRFQQVVERYEARGHSKASAQGQALGIKAGEKGLSPAVYEARLVRCSDLWAGASQTEKIEAMRKAGL